jgi:hypothetical protein
MKRELQLPPVAAADSTTQQFLHHVAHAALGNGDGEAVKGKKQTLVTPLPLHARSFLDELPAMPGADAITAALKPLMQRVAIVSRWRRASLVAGCLAFPLIVTMGIIFGLRVYNTWQRSQPELGELAQVLNVRAAMNMPWFRNKRQVDDRTFAIYIASHHRQTITNTSEWNTLYALSTIAGEKRRFAEQSLAEHPNPTEMEIREATAAVRPLTDPRGMNLAFQPWFPLVVFGASLLFYVCLPALVAGLIFRSGLVLLACGLVVGRRDGTRASRARVLWRGVVAWSPVLLAPVLLAMFTPVTGVVAAASLLAVLWGGLTAWSLMLSDRSLQDRLAGTWLIPR